MSAALIEAAFPQLARNGYRITSAESPNYNCFAWGFCNTQRWWSPVKDRGYYWPEGTPVDLTVDTFVRVYMKHSSYGRCASAAHESGFEKLAIYANVKGEVTHVARQLPSGKWTSKLGDWEDIEHNTLAAIEGQFYGKAVQILKRPL